MPETRIVIRPDGRVEIEGVGYQGTECLEALQKLMESLGRRGIAGEARTRLKPEAYQAQRATVKQDTRA